MINKKITTYSLLIACLLIMGGFLYLTTFIQPKIIFTPKVNKPISEDYKRNLSLHVKVITPFKMINHVKIENPAPNGFLMQLYLHNNDKVLILSGGGYSGDTELQEQLTISLKNTSDDELLKELKNLKVKITWENIWGNKDNKIYYFNDYLK